MLKNYKKLIANLLFLAFFGFTFLTVGGEYLHSCVHQHENQASHDQCPLYKLQNQTWMTLSVMLTALILRMTADIISRQHVIFIQSYDNLSYPRAPPIVS